MVINCQRYTLIKHGPAFLNALYVQVLLSLCKIKFTNTSCTQGTRGQLILFKLGINFSVADLEITLS